MLVLERRLDQGVHVGSDVYVKVVDIRPHRVRLGFEAPAGVPIRRDELAQRDGDANGSAGGPSRPLHILLVEDNDAHVRMITRSLARTVRARVTVNETGVMAMQTVRRLGDDAGTAVPDLILLDLNLPDVSGLEILRSIRSNDLLRFVPVVVLSCSASDEVVAQSLRLGANAFVLKAEQYDEFRASVIKIAEFWCCTRRIA